MRSTLYRLIAACLALSASSPAAAIDKTLTLAQLHHTAWSTRDGAPAQVEALAQTDDGLLWLGSDTGLFFFDGLRFELFHPPEGQESPTTGVAALLAPPGKGLWVGYRFGGVGWWFKGTLHHFTRVDGLPSGSVMTIGQDARGDIWAGTTTGLARFDGTHWAVLPQTAGYPKGGTYALHCDRAGTFWAVSDDGTWKLPRGAKRFERSTRSISYAWLAERPDGRMWESNGTQGLWPLDDTDKPTPLQTNKPGPGDVGPLLFDRDGALWFAGKSGMTRLVDPDHMPALLEGGDVQADSSQRFTRDDGLSGDQILAVLEDREGSIWASTSGGLDRFRVNKFERQALPKGFLWPSLAPAPGEGVLAGSIETTAQRFGAHAESLPTVGPRVTSVLRDSRGVVWMAGARGLWRIDADVPVAIPMPAQISGLPVQAMADMGGGRLRLAILRRGQWEQVSPGSSEWHAVAEPSGGSDSNPLAMLHDSHGRLWLGYAFNRLVMLDNEQRQTSWSSKDGLQTGSIVCIFAQDSRVWLGGETGLAAVVDGTVHTVQIDASDQLRGVSGIVADGDGNLWLNTAGGVMRLPRQELEAALSDSAHRVKAERFDYQDGLDGAPAQLRPVPTAVAADNGLLWFSTTNSVLSIDPRRIHRNPLQPPVQILSIKAAGRNWPLSHLSLPVGTSELDLRYTAGALAQPERVQFRVQLEGVDKNWQDVGTQRLAHYTNLAPGHYEFRVVAANEDGVQSASPASMEFDIPPAFNQTWWFRLMWIPISALAVWLLALRRLKQLSGRYKDRHDAMLFERERIARELHDTLLQSVQGLILRFQSGVNRMQPDDKARIALERCLDRAEKVLEEGRDRVTELRSSIRGPRTLGELLRSLGEELSEAYEVAFAVTLREEEAPLPAHLLHEAEQIGREALQNAFRHAGASAVHLFVQQSSARLILAVSDNGHGIPPTREFDASREGHWGLTGMRERARSIRGKFVLASSAEEGTRVQLEVRLRRRSWRWLHRLSGNDLDVFPQRLT